MSKIEDFKWGMIVERSKEGIARSKDGGLQELEKGKSGICLGIKSALSIRVIPENLVTPRNYHYTFWQARKQNDVHKGVS